MSRAIYMHVSALARLSGIRTPLLCGEIAGDAEVFYSQNGHSPAASKPKRNGAKQDETFAKPDVPSNLGRLRSSDSSSLLINPTSNGNRAGSRQVRAVRSRELSR